MFSERIGAVKVEIQIGTMNDALRNSIWNFVAGLIPSNTFSTQQHNQTIDMIARDVLRVPTQRVNHGYPIGWLLDEVQKLTWAEMYDLLEYVVTVAATRGGLMTTPNAPQQANYVLAREHSGYRFVNGKLAPITNSAEISEIESAAERATAAGLDGARQHIGTAVGLFGQRPQPDYRNAIKEAISAVEAVVKGINGTRGGGLHDALGAVSAKIEMHHALKAGLEKLYGYTSDEDGIRHAILEETTADEADARFMIVTCSAFVNFLIVKAEAAGLLPSRQE
jgi:AbiJ N-terminal domain 4